MPSVLHNASLTNISFHNIHVHELSDCQIPNGNIRKSSNFLSYINLAVSIRKIIFNLKFSVNIDCSDWSIYNIASFDKHVTFLINLIYQRVIWINLLSICDENKTELFSDGTITIYLTEPISTQIIIWHFILFPISLFDMFMS